ncbi:MAG: hypothetical protein QM831_31750 [Kofleriaceae bacterium]
MRVPSTRAFATRSRFTLPLRLYSLYAMYAASTIIALVGISVPAGIAIGLCFIATDAVLRFGGRREFRKFHAVLNTRIAGLARGEFEVARDEFRAYAERTKLPTIATLARLGLGAALTRLGAHAEVKALSLDTDARFSGTLTTLTLYPSSAQGVAFSCALLGEIEAAERWVAEAESRRAVHRSASTFDASQIYTRALIACRRGDPTAAATLLDDHWTACEVALPGSELRPMRVVRAFAVAMAGGPRDAGRAEQMIAALRPMAYEREFAFLGATWPEMDAFLAAHFNAPRS